MAEFSAKSWPLDKQVPKVAPSSIDDDSAVFFSTSALAHNVFGHNGTKVAGNTPYLEFQYFVKINLNSLAKEFYVDYIGDHTRPSIDYAPLVQSIDMPGMSVETDKLNEYNNWRISQTKIEFDPIKLSIHDTVNGRGLALWRMYYEYYFNDGNIAHYNGNGKLNPVSVPSGTRDYGFHLNYIQQYGRYLISSIDIYQLHQTRCNHVRLIHPRISDFSQGSMTYENSSAMLLDFTLDYEYAVYSGGIDVSAVADGELSKFLQQSEVPDIRNPFDITTKSAPEKTDDSNPVTPELQADIAEITNPVNPNSIDAQLGAMNNQLQMDLGKVEVPKLAPPVVRSFSVDTKGDDTGYPDVGRAGRNS